MSGTASLLGAGQNLDFYSWGLAVLHGSNEFVLEHLREYQKYFSPAVHVGVLQQRGETSFVLLWEYLQCSQGSLGGNRWDTIL
jgi:hypothetical protein